MKTLTVYRRKVTERTQFRKYRFKEVEQITILFDGKEYSNHSEDIENKRLRIPFAKVLETRSNKATLEYLKGLGRTSGDQFQKETINRLIEGLN